MASGWILRNGTLNSKGCVCVCEGVGGIILCQSRFLKVYTISLRLDTVNQSVMLTGSGCLSPRISC